MNMPIIDVAVGLTFMFLVLSFCATAIAEGLTEWRQWRGRLLHSKLQTLLGKDLVAHLYSERRVADLASGAEPEIPFPLVDASSEVRTWRLRVNEWWDEQKNKGRGRFTTTSIGQARQLATRMSAKRLPSQIPSAVFADVLLDWLQGISLPNPLRSDAITPQTVPYGLAQLWQQMNRRADGDQDALRSEIIGWYEQVTERMTGDFKRKIRIVLYVIGLGIVLAANADSINIAKTLYVNPQLRAQVAATAEDLTRTCPQGINDCPQYQKHLRNILMQSSEEASSALLGWRVDEKGRPNWAWWSPIGWLLTILAIGMGADFWFGALKRIVSVKGATSEPEQETTRGPPSEGAKPSSNLARSNSSSRDPIDINVDELAPLKGFQPLRFAESHIHAFWLAQFASLAYNALDELKNSDLLKRHKMTVSQIDHGATQVFLFRGEQVLIVAFRGTEQLPEDWIADANMQPDQQPWGVEDSSIFVHKGFHTSLDLVWPELREELVQSQHPVWFTGHSLGGALAVLAAYRLTHCEGGKPPTVGGVYTFGQPRVGNVNLARSCSVQLSQRIFRYVNSSDIVPLVPPSKPIEYVHFGNVRYFDSAGFLHMERTLWERVAEQLTPALREIISDQADWGTIAKKHLLQRVADHSMTRYVQCLERVESISALRK